MNCCAQIPVTSWTGEDGLCNSDHYRENWGHLVQRSWAAGWGNLTPAVSSHTYIRALAVIAGSLRIRAFRLEDVDAGMLLGGVGKEKESQVNGVSLRASQRGG